ncbi:sulfite exporter TauE/SafE family protein [Mesorhizobium xinjiangense]|uniref:sulfite exporter TauE/SafE family protein n=1 Tax=Mesorhizobium xinjiangense TaxID=2678685 RepID=UPI0012ECF611|nr:sulfite exporter TauE/SafE family protein [Mesorhizobium xinjiangense]
MGGLESLAGFLPDGIGVAAAAFLVLASFFTSALTAAFGVGGGVAMLGLLGLFIPVAALIPVHGAVQFGSNTGRAWHQRANIRYAIALPFLVGSLVGAVVGAFVVVQLPDAVMKLVLGTFLIVVVWSKMPGAERLGRAGLAIGSAVLALATMFVGATGPLLSAFFAQILPDDRKALVATHAAGMTVQHALKVVVFALAGFAFWQWLPLIAVMIGSGYAGTVHGTKLLHRMPQKTFRTWFRIGVTLLALDMIRRGIAGLM